MEKAKSGKNADVLKQDSGETDPMSIKTAPMSRPPIKRNETQFRQNGTIYEVVSKKGDKWGACSRWAKFGMESLCKEEDRKVQLFDAEHIEANRCDQTFKKYDLGVALAALGEGCVLHYASTNGWIRGKIAIEDGIYMFRPTALVGPWDRSVLPAIRRDGTLSAGSSAVNAVATGKMWAIDHASQFYELGDEHRGEGKPDPTAMAEVAITTQDNSDRELIRLRSIHARAFKALLMAKKAPSNVEALRDMRVRSVALGDKAALKALLEEVRDVLAALDDPNSEVMDAAELASVRSDILLASMNFGARDRLKG